MREMNNRVRVLKDIFWILSFSGLVAALLRMLFGLGATTNLTDGIPWGLWKVFNMIAGVALSTSGFTVGFLVYVLRLNRFRPYLKPAILIAFLGYGCSCLALLFDIGLPYRFWHPIFMWNINSFLFEVFWCVLLYFTVTAIELAPLIFEGLKAQKLVRFFHGIAFVVVIIGISLSSLHHSSLGSLFLVSPQRLYPLWYSPRLPLLFILSAMGGGIMFLVMVRIIWAKFYNPEPVFGPVSRQETTMIHDSRGQVCAVSSRKEPGFEMPDISRLALIGTGILLIYLLLKITDLVVLGTWRELLSGRSESWLYGLELTFGLLLPLLLMLNPRTRNKPVPVGMAAGLAAFGLVLNRLNVGIFGYFRDAEVVYFPSLTEWALGLGVITAAGLVFLGLAEYLPVFDDKPANAYLRKIKIKSTSTSYQVWNVVLADSLHRVSLLAVFVIPISFILMYPPYRVNEAVLIKPSLGVDLQRRILEIDGDRRGYTTTFNHADHQRRLGDTGSCARCHHICVPKDKSTPCFRCHQYMHDSTNIFNHEEHKLFVARDEKLSGWHPENYACEKCHSPGVPRTKNSVRDCLECHRENMFLVGEPTKEMKLMYANSFCLAMHENCLACHRLEAMKPEYAHLGECSTCHKTLQRKDREKIVTVELR